jgi:multicomponent Na+:H+ antiporter subunit D
MPYQSLLPIAAICVSLIAALLIKLSDKHPDIREFWTIAAAFIKFGILTAMIKPVMAGTVFTYTLVRMLPGFEIAFKVDALGLFFALMASFLWIVTSFYSISYMRAEKEHAQTRYFMSFAIALSAVMGVAFSANLLTMFIFYEILTLCTFPLVAHKETPTAMAGARRYLTYLLGTSLLFLMPAIVLTYTTAGTLDFAPAGFMSGAASPLMLTIIFVLFMAGIAKAGMMPFHAWLPAAMVAPTPVSALLHAVAVVKTGVFVVIKVVVHVFGIKVLSELGLGTALAYYACFTIIAASTIAMMQDNLKARLAYSTISQLSYIVLGAALLSTSALTGSIMHMVLHGFGKITLFFTAGAIYVATHKTNVSQLNGIGRQMPFTMGAFTLGALSMIGIPPLGGFLTKWYLVNGAIEAGQMPILVVLAVSTILNACYFLPIIYRAFFKEPDVPIEGIKEAPVIMVASLSLTALGAVALFFKPDLFLGLARYVVAAAQGGM